MFSQKQNRTEEEYTKPHEIIFLESSTEFS